MLLPSLRLGYVVAPPSLTPRLAQVPAYLLPSPSAETQRVVADLVAEGHLGRHIRRTRTLYLRRRAALASAIETSCGKWLHVRPEEAGLHLLAMLDPGVDDIALVREAWRAGLGIAPLSPWGAEARYSPGLLLSFANLPAAAAEAQTGRLAEVFARYFG